MTKVVATGKTIEDAVEQGLSQLGTSRERVNVTVLEQPSKGFLGFIGARKAKVELTILPEPAVDEAKAAESSRLQASPVQLTPEDFPMEKPSALPVAEAVDKIDPYEEAVRFVSETAAGMGLDVEVELRHGKDESVMDISGSDLGVLIGRRGQTLDALQYLTNIVANRHADGFVKIVLDAENFRLRRQKTLENLAERLAAQVARSGKEVMLEPMPPNERKIIHAALQRHPEIRTFSKGDEPNRRVIITKK
ncbi:protein jag [Paenibacillus sp. P96]|uniref:RNA-binding protein KhpB n=1 Tax=Paenibacillus zeirhizosphaerae TaxID=2987519 RepID=A0ABT9FPL1_9BACL|nr:RNA-binding cell elongation regulator Jag/EloR [Paenibacillus sp. P96]MDP4096461.1 protein jag [Paenibacillus sp. P96]